VGHGSKQPDPTFFTVSIKVQPDSRGLTKTGHYDSVRNKALDAVHVTSALGGPLLERCTEVVRLEPTFDGELGLSPGSEGSSLEDQRPISTQKRAARRRPSKPFAAGFRYARAANQPAQQLLVPPSSAAPVKP
jgi:hypothetical protein